MRARRTAQVARIGLFAVSVSAVAAHSSASVPVGFHPLGYLNNTGIFESQGLAISADGSTVAGRTTSPNSGNQPFEAFRWTAASGMVGIGDLPGDGFFSGAYGMSGDGSVIVGAGHSTASGSATIGEAFRWTQAGGMVGLGDLPGGDFGSIAAAASFDGSVIAGKGTYGTGGTENEAFRWTQAGGMVGLGFLLPADTASAINDMTPDGSVLVGSSGLTPQAAVWTQAGGWQGLGTFPGVPFTWSNAQAISADGSTIIGTAFGFAGFEAFRWTSAGGMVGLGDLPGGSFESYANGGVSADGSVIVGGSKTALGDEAFIWDAVNGTRNLKAVLESDYGFDLTGWRLEEAIGMSDDGLTITGWGFNPDGLREAWVVQIPAPGALGLLGAAGLLSRRRR